MNMVEKMARAMWKALENDTLIGEWDKTYEDHGLKARLMRCSVPVLRALEEPTEAMVDAFAEGGAVARDAVREKNHRIGRSHPNAVADAEWVPAAWAIAIRSAITEAESK